VVGKKPRKHCFERYWEQDRKFHPQFDLKRSNLREVWFKNKENGGSSSHRFISRFSLVMTVPKTQYFTVTHPKKVDLARCMEGSPGRKRFIGNFISFLDEKNLSNSSKVTAGGAPIAHDCNPSYSAG
jgi:hypothetical protein